MELPRDAEDLSKSMKTRCIGCIGSMLHLSNSTKVENVSSVEGRDIHVNPGNWGSRPPNFGMGVVGSPWNIVISYNVQKHEMRALSKVVTFNK